MFGRESSVVYEDVEDLSTLLLQAMWTPSLKSAPQTIQSTLFLYLLSLTILPHNVVPWAILQYLSPWSLLNESKSGIEETINEKVKITQDKGFGAALPAPTVEIKVGTSSPISYSLANAIKKYGCGWDEYVVGKDITLADETNHGKWNISKGERVIAAHWMSPDFAPFKDTADENVVQEAFEQRKYSIPISQHSLMTSSWLLRPPSHLRVLRSNIPSLHSQLPKTLRSNTHRRQRHHPPTLEIRTRNGPTSKRRPSPHTKASNGSTKSNQHLVHT